MNFMCEPVPLVETKICARCKRELAFEMFNTRSNGKPDCYCKPCRPIIFHNWRMNNLDKERQRQKLYRRNNKVKVQEQRKEYNKRWNARLKSRFIRWQRGAGQRDIPFDLTLEQLESMPLICYYTGETLTLEGNKWNTISLDRLDSSKGYTKDNVVYCCVFVNLMKHELSYDQLIDTCKSILDRHKERQIKQQT